MKLTDLKRRSVSLSPSFRVPVWGGAVGRAVSAVGAHSKRWNILAAVLRQQIYSEPYKDRFQMRSNRIYQAHYRNIRGKVQVIRYAADRRLRFGVDGDTAPNLMRPLDSTFESVKSHATQNDAIDTFANLTDAILIAERQIERSGCGQNFIPDTSSNRSQLGAADTYVGILTFYSKQLETGNSSSSLPTEGVFTGHLEERGWDPVDARWLFQQIKRLLRLHTYRASTRRLLGVVGQPQGDAQRVPVADEWTQVLSQERCAEELDKTN